MIRSDGACEGTDNLRLKHAGIRVIRPEDVLPVGFMAQAVLGELNLRWWS